MLPCKGSNLNADTAFLLFLQRNIHVKMVRISLTVFLFSLILTGCRAPSGEQAEGIEQKITQIQGILENGAGREVILEELGAREYIPIDTVLCDGDGRFQISFTPGGVAFYALRTGPDGYITLLLEEGETLTFRGSFGETGTYQVSGSPGSELLMQLSAEHKHILDQMGDIARQNTEARQREDYSMVKQDLDQKFDSLRGAFRSYSWDFIRENEASLSIIVALYNMYGRGLPVFEPGSDMEVYAFVDSVLYPRYKGFEAVDLLHGQLEEAKAAQQPSGNLAGLTIGDKAPDFVSWQADGTPVALGDLRGNHVLLVFWAGWSQPSRQENVFLEKALQRYAEEGFQILQVSLDDNRDTWTMAVREDNLKGLQVSDLKRWESPVALMYQVEKIPSNYLVDPHGMIVARDVYGEALLGKLEQIYGR
jgi:peroxiredoxin